ncbi:hypothetical protein DSM112329_03100 [Paraconexibacter sp. AEG42_29]|uniref:Aldose 1-epimerase n=1 Tax=Paraconexibacter sp. AEG42_29 TaxID=2997339 RepID=A0AAU7AWZ8_9ACTN
MITLRAGDLEADWLPDDGMVGASLRWRGGELLGQRGGLDAYRAKGSAFGIPLLAPWANRLDGLQYGGVTIDPDAVKLDGNGLPKDGVLAGRTWTVAEQTDDHAVVTLDADEAILAVFPFPHAWQVAVTLAPDAMTVATTLTATGDVPVPIAFGWHPLFQLPGVPRAELDVTLPVTTELTLDDRGIPDGGTRPAEWATGPLADRTVDAEYSAFDGDLVLRGGDLELRASFGGDDYPVGHAWAPAGEPFVAWEPMTAPTNALVTGDGLRHVQPGESFTATFSVHVRKLT